MGMNYDSGDVQIVFLGGVNKSTGVKNPTELTGYFLRVTEFKSKYGIKPMYVFRTPEGDKGLPGSGNLNKIMATKQIGLLTHVIDTGAVKDVGKGNPMKVFKVGQDSSDTIDTASISSEIETNAFSYGEDDSGQDLFEEAQEPAPVRPTAPKVAASIPDQSRQAKIQAMLNKSRPKTA